MGLRPPSQRGAGRDLSELFTQRIDGPRKLGCNAE